MQETSENTLKGVRILIIEDEVAIAEGLVDLCEFKGYPADHVQDGVTGLERALSGAYDLVILDLMLPGMDGFTVCNRLREKDRELPVIILSAKTSEQDIIEGLSLGADDYISKPFSVETLFARIQAVLRRSRKVLDPADMMAIGDLRVRFRDYTGSRKGEEIIFTRKEIEILEYLWRFHDRVIPRHQLLHEVWGYENAEAVDTRTVDIHITKLRKKIEIDPSRPRILQTLRGEGYQLCTQSGAH
ncbi:MAG TPA: response regulator transcription factor [Fibrobacteraceae bacterium]|nr:response regulator transcription factor [Fibrobacteraceae bacterium]